MSDIYTQLSEVLCIRSQEEEDWIKDKLTAIDQAINNDVLPKDTPKWITDWPDGYQELGFDWEIDRTGKNPKLWVHGDDVNLDALAEFIQRFLKRFDEDGCWRCTWAGTCSKYVIGEFGGGAMFVTAQRASFMNAWDWPRKLQKQRKARNDG